MNGKKTKPMSIDNCKGVRYCSYPLITAKYKKL
ncbi:hypothetical protein SAMN04487762_0952 [Polaribacter sp. Hel1_33_78]|nr:hypothetical protein SAMN04487762_0952 [Polaribacter sp. Hel1_33_78]